MRVAICCEAEDAAGLVAATFQESPFLLMIDVEKNEIYHVYGKQDPENLVLAQKVAEADCEALICGPIEEKPFQILAKAGVSRFDGSGHKAQRAFIRFLRNQLPLIRDYIGGSGPLGHSHDLSCECGEDSGEHAHGTCAALEREDTLFELSAEEAAALPDEIEIPDDLNREQMEDYLRSLAGASEDTRGIQQ